MSKSKPNSTKNVNFKADFKPLDVQRRYTKPGVSPYDVVQWDYRSSVISDPNGAVVFKMDNIEVPKAWSQLATDIVVSKYFRKAGVPGAAGCETSVRQVVFRLANTIRNAGENLGGYFGSGINAQAFEDELSHMLLNQMGAFNSPVWFNCGLGHVYGIQGSGGNHYWNPKTDSIEVTTDAYTHPQCSACFIQKVEDDLMSIFDLAKNEAKLFKYGSGTGSNFSKIRGRQEKLGGGGTSSGLMSFLEVLDRGAGATKSGGTTRRAAKMVCLDMDHPEIVDLINWKVREERKVAALIAAGYSADFNGDAYHTVAGQNSNNSVQLSNTFMQAVLDDGQWQTRLRTTGEVCETFGARDLWNQIAYAAWACADPGVQFDTIINDMHTCPNTDRINASNPCSEYMFLDDSACNLSSINLMKFLNSDGSFDIEGYKHACRIFFIAQEILVDFASYPTQSIAQNSHDYRPLGLGYANLGTLLMVCGIPYDSEKGFAMAGAITAIMNGTAYLTSSELAQAKGPFAGYAANREPFLRVMNQHRSNVLKIDSGYCPADLLKAAQKVWDQVLDAGEVHGFRNAQATVLAPTGTIGLLMDCDTTGVEPDFSLTKFKKLAGGGYFKIVNQSVYLALQNLGYAQGQIEEILTYIKGTGSLIGAPFVNTESLRDKGFLDEDLSKIEAALPAAYGLTQIFSVWTLGEATLKRLGLTEAQWSDPQFNLLQAIGFTEDQIDKAENIICGMATVEAAPHLKLEHYPVFDCANKCGKYGTRFILPMGHIRMMGAAQAFISGAISKTVNLPHEATVDEIQQIYLQAWNMGLKAVALYRDGCKLSQPLSSGAKKIKEQETSVEVKTAEPLSTSEVWAKGLHRKSLPRRRHGITYALRVGGTRLYLRTGEYDDGTLGEIFIDIAKEGSSIRSLLNSFAMAVSLGLQNGVPLPEYVDMFTFTRFEPSGPVAGHDNIKFCTSIVDLVFRVLGFEYLGRTDFVQVKPEDLSPNADTGLAPQVTGGSKTLANPDVKIQAKAPELNSKVFAIAGKLSEATQLQRADEVSGHLASMMGDAPFCDGCGHVTVRNGACYKCLNCGNSMGCS